MVFCLRIVPLSPIWIGKADLHVDDQQGGAVFSRHVSTLWLAHEVAMNKPQFATPRARAGDAASDGQLSEGRLGDIPPLRPLSMVTKRVCCHCHDAGLPGGRSPAVRRLNRTVTHAEYLSWQAKTMKSEVTIAEFERLIATSDRRIAESQALLDVSIGVNAGLERQLPIIWTSFRPGGGEAPATGCLSGRVQRL